MKTLYRDENLIVTSIPAQTRSLWFKTRNYPVRTEFPPSLVVNDRRHITLFVSSEDKPPEFDDRRRLELARLPGAKYSGYCMGDGILSHNDLEKARTYLLDEFFFRAFDGDPSLSLLYGYSGEHLWAPKDIAFWFAFANDHDARPFRKARYSHPDDLELQDTPPEEPHWIVYQRNPEAAALPLHYVPGFYVRQESRTFRADWD